MTLENGNTNQRLDKMIDLLSENKEAIISMSSDFKLLNQRVGQIEKSLEKVDVDDIVGRLEKIEDVFKNIESRKAATFTGIVNALSTSIIAFLGMITLYVVTHTQDIVRSILNSSTSVK